MARKKHSAPAAPFSDYVTSLKISGSDLRLIHRLTQTQPSPAGSQARGGALERSGKVGSVRVGTSKKTGKAAKK